MSTPFEAEDVVWQYRLAHETKDAAECLRLRNAWKESEGEVALHEMAFGEPIEPEAVAERKQLLADQLRQIKAELAWLATIGTAKVAVRTSRRRRSARAVSRRR